MSDRPGSLAALAERCGSRGANILGLQIFPGVAGVTDELVLRTPEGWCTADVAELVEEAGGEQVSVGPCTEHALTDGPTRYLQALAGLVRRSDSQVGPVAAQLSAQLSALLDAAPAPAPGEPDAGLAEVQDTLTVDVGGDQVVLRRTTPFTDTERARAAAFADAAEAAVGGATGTAPAAGTRATPGPDGAGPTIRRAAVTDSPALVRMHGRCSADSVYRRYDAPLARIDDRFARRLLVTGAGAVVAALGEEVVGIASVSSGEDGAADVALLVEDGWQRRGLGSRLLSAAARLARGHGATEVVLRSRTHDPALMSLAFSSGMRARIRTDGEGVVVTVGIAGLKPLPPVAGAAVAPVPARAPR